VILICAVTSIIEVKLPANQLDEVRKLDEIDRHLRRDKYLKRAERGHLVQTF